MANTADMIRLMRHGAELLANSDPTSTYSEDQRECIAAMAFAESLLRMVAAAMDDEPVVGEGKGQEADQ